MAQHTPIVDTENKHVCTVTHFAFHSYPPSTSSAPCPAASAKTDSQRYIWRCAGLARPSEPLWSSSLCPRPPNSKSVVHSYDFPPLNTITFIFLYISTAVYCRYVHGCLSLHLPVIALPPPYFSYMLSCSCISTYALVNLCNVLKMPTELSTPHTVSLLILCSASAFFFTDSEWNRREL